MSWAFSLGSGLGEEGVNGAQESVLIAARQVLDLLQATQNIADGTLDRSYEYDHVGRLAFSHSGAEARAHAYSGQWGTMDGPYSHGYEYDVWGNLTHRYGWGGEVQGGGAGQSSDIYYYHDTHNRRTGFSYDNAGNLTFDGGQNFTYDATGQQTNASYSGYSLQQSYDGDGLRVKKVDNGWTTYYLRSSVLGGQVVAEISWFSVAWGWNRGYVYACSQLLAVQQGGVNWMHEDPITKSKRVTNSAGNVVSTIELDPWGADTSRSSNAAFQPKKFTSYERDSNGTDEAMFRRYNRWHSRFDQPDPYDGSYDMSDPQSFNRYSYTQNDPVNFVDPTGLKPQMCGLFSGSNHGDPWTGLVCFGDSNPFYGYSPKDREPPDPVGKEPQNSSTNTDPCDHLLPANVPPSVSVDENIRTADGLYRQATQPIPDLGGSAARGAQPFVIFMDFYNRVKGGGPWDYKLLDAEGLRLTGRSRYEEFGNFNFGATGAAERIPTSV